jgi:hypothetical protein
MGDIDHETVRRKLIDDAMVNGLGSSGFRRDSYARRKEVQQPDPVRVTSDG